MKNIQQTIPFEDNYDYNSTEKTSLLNIKKIKELAKIYDNFSKSPEEEKFLKDMYEYTSKTYGETYQILSSEDPSSELHKEIANNFCNNFAKNTDNIDIYEDEEAFINYWAMQVSQKYLINKKQQTIAQIKNNNRLNYPPIYFAHKVLETTTPNNEECLKDIINNIDDLKITPAKKDGFIEKAAEIAKERNLSEEMQIFCNKEKFKRERKKINTHNQIIYKRNNLKDGGYNYK